MWRISSVSIAHPEVLTLIAGQSFTVGRVGGQAGAQGPTLTLSQYNSVSRGTHATVTARLDESGSPVLDVTDSSTHGVSLWLSLHCP